MRFSPLQSLAAIWLVSVSSTQGYRTSSTAETDILATVALANLAIYTAKYGGNECTLENAAKRREWGTLSARERIAYTDAVKCLISKPSKYDSAEVPGARTRYDDFVAVHINQTLSIHGTANFLSWHRYFTWVFEHTLRTECGYQGYQPYWNWGKYAHDPVNSPVFDGSATSMGGNGVFEAHNCTNGLPTGLSCIPPGKGGGCVESGPFANFTVNLGPIAPTLAEPEEVPAPSLLAYNPRCLKRDVSEWVSSRWTTDRNSSDLIQHNHDVGSFQTVMQGDFASGQYGVHAGGHFTIGGDPGGDLFASPGDPAFFLHHAQIDRTWWIWQNQDPKTRTTAIAGTITLNNSPPSRNGTLQDLLDMGVNADTLTIGDVVSTVGVVGSGPLCYIYV